jgi:hypothetical protein
MTRAHIISRDGIEEVSGREFYTRAFGHAPHTRAEREAEYRAELERYADMIEAGSDWGIPPPCLADARRIVAERAGQLTECRGDPLLKAKRA